MTTVQGGRSTGNMSTEDSSAEDGMAALRWQCRRGMLELDILLNHFVEIKAAALSLQQRQTFELLLTYPDQAMLDLLLGNAVSSDPEIAELILRIRATANT